MIRYTIMQCTFIPFCEDICHLKIIQTSKLLQYIIDLSDQLHITYNKFNSCGKYLILKIKYSVNLNAKNDLKAATSSRVNSFYLIPSIFSLPLSKLVYLLSYYSTFPDLYLCTHLCIYVRMYACMHTCMYVCMYVCIYVTNTLYNYITIVISTTFSIFFF